MTNLQQLEDLAWSLEASQGEFKLILAKCNYINLQNQLIQELQKICEIEIQILRLQTSERTLYNAIREEFDQEIAALMIVGWESLPNLSKMFSSANQIREEFRNNCQYPVVLWINDQIYQQIMESAPDLESWGITINFSLPFDELINLLKSIIDKVLNDDLNVNLQEFELALQDLQKNGQDLEPDFQANCNFLKGFIEYNKKRLDTAINYYQQSWDFWQTTDNLEIQGKILYHLTICNYEKLRPNPPAPFPAREGGEIIICIQRTLEKFKNAQRLDLIANSLSKFGLILQDLQAWEQLKELSQQALEIHQAENNILKIAEDYIFLATANFEQSNFSEADKIANQGVGVIHELPLLNYYRQSLFLILAQAQEKLQQHEQAISNLKLAKDMGVINNHPKLYVKILNLLQQLLFQKTEYLEAFNTKLESRSIEQQFGLRAFIGAGWLKPAKNTNLNVETFHGTSLQTNYGTSLQTNQTIKKENISPEIEASGRKIDVDKLLESIGRNDKKIIVIHGQSGVGKSSLVNAGLIPALENKAIGFKDNLPVTIRVYNSWFTELAKQLLDVLPAKFKPAELKLDTQEEFILKLVEIEQRNLRTVLIFDQFEEFFFVCPDDKARTEFFKFLGKCLNHKNIGSLRIILSLRVDYLHLLLECDEIPDMNIVGDGILSKNVLYKLGNLTPDNAKTTIESLTKKTTFQLEPDLINRLVEDLAGELGSVRPIELQVVGAQLETENITTLAAYQKIGNKQQLVKRYLGEIVKDCGKKNQELAELLLYFLTDEQGTRPLKTKVELEADLKSLLARDKTKAENKLDLVLEIFVKSGLVVLLPENPCERYQLVHDYLALFIRQQQEPKLRKIMELTAKLAYFEEKQRLSAIRLNITLKIALTASITASIIVIFSLTTSVITSTDSEMQTLSASSEALFASQKGIDALRESLKAGKKLKRTLWINTSTKEKVLTALYQAVYGVKERNRLEGHLSGVRMVTFSADKSLIASASADTTINLWSPNGILVKTLSGHVDVVNSVSFSPDSQILASASQDKTIKLWNRKGKLLKTLLSHTSVVNSVSFHPYEKIIASASTDQTIKLWSQEGKLLKTLVGHKDAVLAVAWSHDGKILASSSADKTIKLWSREGQLLKTWSPHEDNVSAIAWSPNSEILASASMDKKIKLWSRDGTLLKTLSGHSSGVISVDFSNDGHTLASASMDETIKIWSLDGNLLGTLRGHNSWVNSVSFSPDGLTLASAGRDKTIILWRWDSLIFHHPQTNDDWVTSISFSPDSRAIAGGCLDKTIKIWNRDGKLLKILTGHNDQVWGVAWSPDGKIIASASKDKTIKLWSRDGTLLKTLNSHTDTVLAVEWSPDSKIIASSSKDKTIKLWSRDGTLLKTLNGHTDAVNWVSFSPNGKFLASASDDKSVKIWTIDGEVIKNLTGHTRRVNGVAWSPNGKLLASVSLDSTVKIWSENGILKKTLMGYGDGFISVKFSPDGQTLAVTSDNKLRLWNREGVLLMMLKGDLEELSSVSFSPDGQILAAGSDKDNVILRKLSDITLESLLKSNCNILKDYLLYNPNMTRKDGYKDQSYRSLCEND